MKDDKHHILSNENLNLPQDTKFQNHLNQPGFKLVGGFSEFVECQTGRENTRIFQRRMSSINIVPHFDSINHRKKAQPTFKLSISNSPPEAKISISNNQ